MLGESFGLTSDLCRYAKKFTIWCPIRETEKKFNALSSTKEEKLIQRLYIYSIHAHSLSQLYTQNSACKLRDYTQGGVVFRRMFGLAYRMHILRDLQ